MIEFEVPLSPSVNHYLLRNNNRSFTTKKAKDFQTYIMWFVKSKSLNVYYKIPLEVHYDIYFSDKRKRDIANHEKVLTDALVKAGVMVDDSLIHKLILTKKGFVKQGKIVVRIMKYNIDNI